MNDLVFKPRKIRFNLNGVVPIIVSQDDDGWLRIKFEASDDYLLSPKFRAEDIHALGFPTEPMELAIEDCGNVQEEVRQ